MKKLIIASLICFLNLLIKAQDCSSPPSGLALTNVTSCTTTLSWSPVAEATKYRVKYRVNGTSAWSKVVSIGISTSYSFTGLSPNTSYQFAVNDQCPSGTKSKYKNLVGTTLLCTSPLITDASSLSTSSIKVSLTASCSFDSVRIQYTHDNLPWQYFATADINNIILNGLLAGTLYTIKASTCPLNINNWTAPVSATTPGNPQKPNIIWIVLDDSRFDTYSCNYGPSWFQTPNIDRIANEGVNFRSFFVTTSFCTPSRSSMVTGLYGHN